jgi:hypothetical protein
VKHSELYIICIDIDIFMGNVRWERCMRNMARNYPMILLYHVFDPIWKKWTVVGDMWIKRWVDGLRPQKRRGRGMAWDRSTCWNFWKCLEVSCNSWKCAIGAIWRHVVPKGAPAC